MQLFLCLFFSTIVAASARYPSITLPWGTWQAESYDEDGKFYTFKNIRYGKAPIGELRFNKPEYPDEIEQHSALQDSSYGPACHQIDTNRCDCPPKSCPKNESPELPFLAMVRGPQSEDCLFLDLYVPASAFEKNVSLPVIVWIHGGGFLFGAKDSQENGLPLYKGDGILQAAAATNEEVIYVAGNYRLGALGFLAGPTVEHEGTPNAGLHDQMLLLRWVHDFAHLVGGNAADVSVWGQSAGGSSILFHLIAEGGKRDPLFKKAVVLSPGFEWQWDNSRGGNMEELYQNFTELVDCADHDMGCLRNSSENSLAQMSQVLYNANKCTGPYFMGPAVDGKLIRSLPSVAFAKGQYWKDISSLVISHVADEASSFVPKYIVHRDDLDQWLHAFLPRSNFETVRKAIADKYSPGFFGDPKNRAEAILRDAFFICNTRHLYDAYNSSSRYMMQYDFLQFFGLSVHGSDLLPLFWNRQLDVRDFIRQQLSYIPGFIAGFLAGDLESFAVAYQRYMVSHAIYGDPNKIKGNHSPKWKPAVAEDALRRVMQSAFSLFGNYFSPNTRDKLNTAAICDFWTEVALNLTELSKAANIPSFKKQDYYVNLEL